MLRRRRTSLMPSPQGSGDENAGALTRFLPGKSYYVTHHITTHHITTHVTLRIAGLRTRLKLGQEGKTKVFISFKKEYNLFPAPSTNLNPNS